MRPVRTRKVMVAVLAAVLLLGGSAGRSWAADPEEAHYNVIVGLYNAGKWQEAVGQIEKREEETALPDAFRAKYLYAKGLAYEKGGKAAEARTAYELLL